MTNLLKYKITIILRQSHYNNKIKLFFLLMTGQITKFKVLSTASTPLLPLKVQYYVLFTEYYTEKSQQTKIICFTKIKRNLSNAEPNGKAIS